jgi:hypothetical protein
VALVERLLAKEPEQRFERPAEVAALLRPLAVGSDLTELAVHARSLLFLARSLEKGIPELEPDAPLSTNPHNLLPTVTANQGAPRLPVGSALRWRRLAYAGLGVLLAGFLLALLLLSRLSGQGSPNAGPTLTQGADLVPPLGQPQELLVQPPQILVRPAEDEFNLRVDHNPRKRAMWVTCGSRTILQLGQTKARRFRFEATLYQAQWSGGVGLFFGYQAEKSGPVEHRYQFVEVKPFLARPSTREGTLDSFCTNLRRLPRPFLYEFYLRSAPIPVPAAGEHTLALVVGPKGLESVTWDGRELPLLLGGTPPDDLSRSSQGGFGIFFRQASARIQQARLTILEEPNDAP